MLGLEWNALRPGDRVFVHHRTSAPGHLVSGTVAIVNTQKNSNGVGIRLAMVGAPSLVAWPNRLAVHRDPRDPAEPCWRCQSAAVAPAA